MRNGLPDHELSLDTLHHSLTDPALESMNFLNEVASRYPEAVSFASGRPAEEFFDVKLIHNYIDTYCRYLKSDCGLGDGEVNQILFQYGRTKGIVHELIARQLRRDEGIDTDPGAIVVTVGCQEAMFITLRALRAEERDILLAISPTYVGLTGAARLTDQGPLPHVRLAFSQLTPGLIETGLDRFAAFVAGTLPVHDERHSTGQYTGSA